MMKHEASKKLYETRLKPQILHEPADPVLNKMGRIFHPGSCPLFSVHIF